VSRHTRTGEAQPADLDAPACRCRALDLLARREHSPLELERKLAVRGFPDPVVAEVLAALEAEGLLDTARFAEAFVESRIGKGQGPLRIRGELRARGVGESEAGRALEPHDWRAYARFARIKKFGEAPPTSFGERARQSRFLQYRGFTSDQIRSALAQR
jgi:regulatory protein